MSPFCLLCPAPLNLGICLPAAKATWETATISCLFSDAASYKVSHCALALLEIPRVIFAAVLGKRRGLSVVSGTGLGLRRQGYNLLLCCSLPVTVDKSVSLPGPDP